MLFNTTKSRLSSHGEHRLKLQEKCLWQQAQHEVWADYIYLDTEERRRFAQVSHEYLIEQLQYQEEAASANQKIKLNFNHPVKELVWTNAAGEFLTQRTKLTLNGHDRFSEQDREYFQLRQPIDHHTAVPGFNVKESERPVMVSPIDTTILTHKDAVADGKAALSVQPSKLTVLIKLLFQLK